MEKVIDWLEGRLNAREAAKMAERVENDPEFAATTEWIRDLMNMTSDFKLVDPPMRLRPALERLFDARRRRPGLLKRLVAQLVSDSWDGQPAPGMRSAGMAAETRQLLFSSDLLDISTTLRPHPGGENFDLLGQILPLAGIDPGICSIELTGPDSTPQLAESDDTGNFEFRDLPDGEYQLIISGPGFEITMPMLKWRS